MTANPFPQSRRRALALLGGSGWWLRAARAEGDPPLRLAISQTMLMDANLNDARAAMRTWLMRMQADLGVNIQIDPKIFSSTEEIARGLRSGQLDAATLNVVEYRPMSNLFDAGEIFSGSGMSGPAEYLLVVRRDREFKRLSDLRGRRLCLFQSPQMCVASAWLATLLEEVQAPPAGEFFGSLDWENKIARVVLPVFFNQAEACVTSKRGFEIMCELNPQVAGSLVPLAATPLLVTCFCAFRKNFHSPTREKFINVQRTLFSSAAGRQLATLFQFDGLSVRDGGCLAPSLGILEKAERIHGHTGAAGRRG